MYNKARNFTDAYLPLERAFSKIIEGPDQLPDFCTIFVTYLLHKKSGAYDPTNFRLITYLTTVYKLFTSIKKQDMSALRG